jgi:V8-like Glu-specific endopeptidase
MLRSLFGGLTRDRNQVRNVLKAPGRHSKRRSCVALEPLEGRALMTLTPIAPGSGFPYSTVVELQITFPDNQHFVGSGVMVGPNDVLTAGHVVYSYADGGFATSILATPELNGKSAPFGSAYMTRETTYNTWIAYSKAHPGLTAPGDMDIALFSLNKNIGNNSGWMSYGYNNNNSTFASGTILNTAGFPAAGGYNGLQEEFSAGAIAGLSSDGSAIEYYQSQITTFGGQSGSPVWAYYPSTGQRIVYGIHVGGSGTPTSENFATRITQGIFNDIGSWIKADGPAAQVAPAVAVAVNGSSASSTADAVVVPVATTPQASALVGLFPLQTTGEGDKVGREALPSTVVALVPLTTTPDDGTVIFGMTVPNNKPGASLFQFAYHKPGASLV